MNLIWHDMNQYEYAWTDMTFKFDVAAASRAEEVQQQNIVRVSIHRKSARKPTQSLKWNTSRSIKRLLYLSLPCLKICSSPGARSTCWMRQTNLEYVVQSLFLPNTSEATQWRLRKKTGFSLVWNLLTKTPFSGHLGGLNLKTTHIIY